MIFHMKFRVWWQQPSHYCLETCFIFDPPQRFVNLDAKMTWAIMYRFTFGSENHLLPPFRYFNELTKCFSVTTWKTSNSFSIDSSENLASIFSISSKITDSLSLITILISSSLFNIIAICLFHSSCFASLKLHY